ncbi:hypothetical protein VTO73DRAFT_8898 [Trametes versicolor]
MLLRNARQCTAVGPEQGQKQAQRVTYTRICTTAPTPARPTLAHRPHPVIADIPQASPSLKPQPTTTIHHSRGSTYPPNAHPSPSAHLGPLAALPPECDSVVRNGFEEAEVALRRDAPPARTTRAVFSLFSPSPDSTSLLWASSRTRCQQKSSYPRSARGHATGRTSGPPTHAGRGGRTRRA